MGMRKISLSQPNNADGPSKHKACRRKHVDGAVESLDQHGAMSSNWFIVLAPQEGVAA